ncbi:hypothetical protein N9B97_01780 [Porticoccaceae bacterium]|nr:hypothetical protein [Porticoccaceae bacterium]
MHFKKQLLVIVATVSLILPMQGFAETITGAQNKELRYKCKDGRPRKTSEFNEVLSQAKSNALRSWAAGKSVAISTLFAENEQQILANIDDYFLNAQVDHRCQGKSFKLKVKGVVDVNRISLLGKAAPVQFSGPRSRMTAVFLARKADFVKSYDTKRTSIEANTTFSEGSETASMSGGSASTEGYSSTKNIKETGGSSESKADKINWNVYRPSGLDAAVNQTFSSFGFRTIDASQVASRFTGFDLEAFKDDFTLGDDLSAATKNNAFDAIAGKIPILVIATVDVGQKDTDPGSGLKRVYATVTAQVYQDDGLFFETVASVKPTQFSGLGPNETVAETNALIKAAESASNEIVQQLNAAGIR